MRLATVLIWVLFAQISTLFAYKCKKVNIYKNLKKPHIYVYRASLYINEQGTNDTPKELRENFDILKRFIKTLKYHYVEETVSTRHTHSLVTTVLGIPEAFYLKRDLKNILLEIVKAHTENTVFVKAVKCGKSYKTRLIKKLDEYKLNFKREAVVNITDLNKKHILILEKARITLKNSDFEAFGKEKNIIYLDPQTRILKKKITEYSFVMKNYITNENIRVSGTLKLNLKKIVRTNKLLQIQLADSKFAKNTPFFNLNSYGLFVSAKINNTINTKLYLDPSSTISLMDFGFFSKNIFKKPKNIKYYFKSVNSVEFLGRKVLNPRFEVLKDFVWQKYFDGIDYKIPGIIAGDVLSRGILFVDEAKRKIFFFKDKKDLRLQTLLKMSEGKRAKIKIESYIPIFKLKVNNSIVKASISLAHFDNYIFPEIQEQLKLPSKTLVITRASKEQVSKKVSMIISPPYGKYFNSSAILVKNLRNKPYDVELGVKYIKNKKLLINYIDGFIAIW